MTHSFRAIPLVALLAVSYLPLFRQTEGIKMEIKG
nr:hypothetical protein [Synechocystis sp. PCC 7339]